MQKKENLRFLLVNSLLFGKIKVLTCPLPKNLLKLFISRTSLLSCHINHAITKASEAFRDIMKFPVAEETKYANSII
jgi:hypothetical protein